MRYTNRWMALVLIIAGPHLLACAQPSAEEEHESKAARVEPIKGTDLSRVILSEEAAKRIALQTVRVQTEQVGGTQRMVIPYAAVLYDANGDAWAYTSPQPLTFVRHRITIDSIEGDLAILSNGPPIGTPVVTVGAAELYGAEFEFEEE